MVLLARIISSGAGVLSWDFLNRFPDPLEPLAGGVKNALWGTIWLTLLTGGLAIPVGVAGAVYLEEYAPHTRLTRFITLNIANLAGVPSIVYGILGLAIFVRWLGCGRSLLAGALTMAVLILPVIIIATREALVAVPNSLRLASFALGATRWQTVFHHVLPAALPGILTGIILALSRAIGEAAPLVVIGATAFSNSVPESLFEIFTVLPILVFTASDNFDQDQHRIAAGAIIVLLSVLLTMNAGAVALRAWKQRSRL